MREKIVVYIVTSADSYIRPTGCVVEWLNRRPSTADYGMRAFYKSIDTILFGRKTYDWALDYQKQHGGKKSIFDRKVANYVFSRKPPKEVAPGVQFVSEPVKAGIPLVARRHPNLSLHLLSTEKYPDGAVRLPYEVAKWQQI
ncbi:MAG TPA: hypothetical protein VM912_08205 [Terriglobales bacterium]|nr:hypothetical protein [Terriglobales bacterium]